MRNHHLLSQYVTALESSALCVRLNAQGQVIFISDSLKNRLNTDQPVVGKGFKQFIDPQHREALADRISRRAPAKLEWDHSLATQQEQGVVSLFDDSFI